MKYIKWGWSDDEVGKVKVRQTSEDAAGRTRVQWGWRSLENMMSLTFMMFRRWNEGGPSWVNTIGFMSYVNNIFPY